MKKISFTGSVLPHLVAVIVFLLVTVFFFNPIFFDNKTLEQDDILMWEGSSKALRDYRAAHGEEGLWAPGMFSGMPAYLVNVEWSNGPVFAAKRVLSLGLPHPVANIFLALISYYVLLLSFRIRPYLAIAGAVAFAFSSYLIIGLGAGHNARIGAIAFMPMVMAGIHLVFSGRRWLGFGTTALGMALHLRENHLQITYYLLIIVLVYGLVRLVEFVRRQQLVAFLSAIGILAGAVIIAAGTFFGPFWAVTEYGKYSMRGPSELVDEGAEGAAGLSKDYAFEYSSGIWEPFTLMIPNFYGGSSGDFLVQRDDSEVYQALVRSGNENANQLASFGRAYWGPQANTAPYYAGAIICFLFVLGIVYAEPKYAWWLGSLAVLAIMLSWGSSFSSFNYFMFDHFPGYNKFRSVTFALIMVLFAMPLLGLLGLEQLLATGWNKDTLKKMAWPAAMTMGVCLVFAVVGGLGNYLRPGEEQLPAWFLNALRADRKQLFIGDVWRSFWFVAIFAAVLVAHLKKWIPFYVFSLITVGLITIDLTLVDQRYFNKDNYQRSRQNAMLTPNAADQEILKDPGNFRVYNLQNPLNEARTSYFHQSIGGYHGAKLRRYQDLFDSCLYNETREMVSDLQSGKFNFEAYGVLNMLNAKYIVYGPEQGNVIRNPAAHGNAWFAKAVMPVRSPAEELKAVCSIDTDSVAALDVSAFSAPAFSYDSASSITLTSSEPGKLTYKSSAATDGLAVFSEIYYPVGWQATIDDAPATILRVNYVLRAMVVPAGSHTITMAFKPRSYTTGNTITMVSSWLLLLVVIGSVFMTYRETKAE